MALEKIEYKGWPNCYRLSNDVVDLVVTTDVGPRVIRFGFVGKENQFREWQEQMGRTGDETWNIFGGHRLWHAPEGTPRSYFPDNHPVELEAHPGYIRLVQPVETTTGIQKEMDISLALQQAQVTVTHRLRNKALWDVELAPWALTVMELGGVTIIPLPPKGTHEKDLLPANSLTLWAYTDMTDARWTWGRQFILLRQDPHVQLPQKVGVMDKDGWAAYARAGNLFVKRFDFIPGAAYPDYGSSVETFTRWDMMELETLGPLTRLAPGSAVEYVEKWYLFDGIPTPSNEDEVLRDVLPVVKRTF